MGGVTRPPADVEGTWAYRLPGTDLDAVDAVLALHEVAVAGLSEERGVVTVWCGAERPDLPSVTGLAGGWWEHVEREDWAERWKEGLRPVVVGRITVLPPWLAGPTDHAEEMTLVIEPGMAFGTGHHETTTGCLRALQDVDLNGRRVIDVGTGTAVLALAASALGAGEVVGVDIDPEAVAVARANVAAHGRAVRIAEGSCDAAGGPADVVLANLITDTLLSLLDDLVSLLRPGGMLIASGIGVARTAEVVAALEQHGLATEARRGEEWAVLVATADRTSSRPRGPGP